MQSFFKSARLACLSALCAFLAACGGGDEKAILYGTASIGMPLAGATVRIFDGNNHSTTATTAANGNYAADVTNFSGPLLLTTSDPTGFSKDLVSVLPAAPAAGGKATANLTPLTTALTALLTADGRVYDLTKDNFAGLVTSSAVDAKVTLLNTAIANLLSYNNVASSGFNPVTSAYSATNTGIDAVNSQVILQSASGVVSLTASSDTSKVLTLNSTVASTDSNFPVFTTPPYAATYLDWLAGEIKTCLAVAVADRASNATCTGIIDSSFSVSALGTAFGESAGGESVGASVGVPQTTAFTLVSSVQQATVRFPYTRADGSHHAANLTVRLVATGETVSTLPDGVTPTWLILSAP